MGKIILTSNGLENNAIIKILEESNKKAIIIPTADKEKENSYDSLATKELLSKLNFEVNLGKEISKDAPDYIKEAAEITDYMNMSKEEQTMVALLEKAMADYDAEMSTAWSRGERSGLQIGIQKGIRALIRLGHSDIDIAQEMEISEETVKEIRTSHKNQYSND